MRQLLIWIVILSPWGVLCADWPPEELAGELGLPSSTGGAIEIRVWLGGGVTRPYEFYRIIQLDGVISVDRIAWTEVTKEAEGLYTAKEATRESKRMRHFMDKYRCAAPLTQTSNFYWCRELVRSSDTWPVLFNDLLPEELWKLPEQLDRSCGWLRSDGIIVTIEILQGQRHHRVEYDNPDFCCPYTACAIVNHVRQLVVENVH